MELRLAFVLALALAACRPEIGDPCETSTDCSPTGERLCDITQKPGGYCTVFNCEPDSCPEEAVCVEFGGARSPVAGCEDPLGSGPYTRTYCLKKCGENNDCRERDGYKCFDPKVWGAVVLDDFSKICGIKPPEGSSVPEPDEDESTRSNDVCTGTVTPPSGAGGAGGAPAEDGTADAGG